MKARVWKEQVDLFEITILEQLVELAPLSLSDLATDQSIDPIVLVGKALSKERVSSFRQIASNAFKSGAAMLLVPPFGDYDISSHELGHCCEFALITILILLLPQALCALTARARLTSCDFNPRIPPAHCSSVRSSFFRIQHLQMNPTESPCFPRCWSGKTSSPIWPLAQKTLRVHLNHEQKKIFQLCSSHYVFCLRWITTGCLR